MCFFRGTVLANKVGRRWTHSSLLGINALLFGAVMVMVSYQVWCERERELMISTYFLFYPKHTDAGVSTVIQVLCMIVKMNISATFIVAYMQAIKSSSSIFANKTYIRHIRCSSCLLPWVRCASGNVFYYKRISTQAMEIFPTPVRQSGIGFITFISQVRLWD